MNRAKPEAYRDKVLMIDARNIYRQVTRKIYDFSPEQEQNILAIVWLYRGQTDKYLSLVRDYCRRALDQGAACLSTESETGETIRPLTDFSDALATLADTIQPFLDTLVLPLPSGDGPGVRVAETREELADATATYRAEVEAFHKALAAQRSAWTDHRAMNGQLGQTVERLAPLAESSRNLVKQADLLYKLATRLIETYENEHAAKSSNAWNSRAITRARKAVDEARKVAVEQLKQVRYFWRQADWLTERFPEAELRDVEGLVKLVDRAELAANDWSLTPGRYVGVAPGRRRRRLRGKPCVTFTPSWKTSTGKPSHWRHRSRRTSRSWGSEKEPTRPWRRSGRLLSRSRNYGAALTFSFAQLTGKVVNPMAVVKRRAGELDSDRISVYLPDNAANAAFGFIDVLGLHEPRRWAVSRVKSHQVFTRKCALVKVARDIDILSNLECRRHSALLLLALRPVDNSR